MTNTDGTGLTRPMARGETARQLREMTNRMPKSLGGWAGAIRMTAVLAAWVAAAPGCGGGSSTPITEDDYCTQKATAECQVAPTCVSVVSACQMQRHSACLAVNAASKSPTRLFVPGNVGACISQTNSVYAKTLSGVATQADITAMNDKCAYVFQGNSTTTCTVKYDCKDQSQICDKGICAKSMQVSKGAFCVSPGQVCSSDSYCATDPATNQLTCLAKAAQSAPCSATVPCVDPFRCDSTSLTCVPKLMSGEFCGSSADCASTVSYCDPYAGCKCDPGLKFAGGASACVDYGGSPSGAVTPACGAGSSPDAGTTLDAATGG